jgi:hypothetical protein
MSSFGLNRVFQYCLPFGSADFIPPLIMPYGIIKGGTARLMPYISPQGRDLTTSKLGTCKIQVVRFLSLKQRFRLSTK